MAHSKFSGSIEETISEQSQFYVTEIVFVLLPSQYLLSSASAN